MFGTLITTKFQIPPISAQAIKRARLITQLDRSGGSKLTIISAPAGFGKTTLVSLWARQHSFPVAWLSLEKDDNDLTRFLAYVIAAVQRVTPELGEFALSNKQTPKPPSFETVLTSLLNELAESNKPIVIIFDDYHLIQSPSIHQAVTFLLDHLPSQARLVIASRADPPLPLARLRGRGQLSEIRQADLRFSLEEASSYLNQSMRINLSSDNLATLSSRTEGWIAGLQMAAVSLQGQDTSRTTSFIQAFAGSNRYIMDYLVEEVLQRQPEHIQTFLLHTAILEHLSGPLCDKLMATDKEEGGDKRMYTSRAQSILEHLETSNLFVIPLDDERRWYRYHKLFADLLRQRLLQSHPDLLPNLHRRASQWHQANGLIGPAIDHALTAYDFDRAAMLIEENTEDTLMRSEINTCLTWVEKLPAECINDRPILRFYHTWALAMSGASPDIVEERLQALGHLPDSGMAGRIAALRAYNALIRADIQHAVEFARQASANLPESDLFLNGIAEWILSLNHLSDGDIQRGKQALNEIARANQESGNILVAVVALCQQSGLQFRQGRLHLAMETIEQALQLATDPQGRRLPIASEALIQMGELKREWNDLDAAAHDLLEAIELSKQWSELAAFEAYFPLARVRMAQGDAEGAREALATARQIAYRSDATEMDDILADLQQAYFLATQGQVARAMQWAQTRGLHIGAAALSTPDPKVGSDYARARLRKYEYIVLARLLIMQGRIAEALELLADLSGLAKQLERIDMTIQVQILIALAFQQNGDQPQALAAIGEALTLAEPGGYRRIFLDEGEAMGRLLDAAASHNLVPAYVTSLQTDIKMELAANLRSTFAGQSSDLNHPAPSPALIEPLSRRELDVLRLLATGMSNPEIAEELVVAVSTVRSHCKSLYAKLGVHKRWDAVQCGKQLGLI